MNTKTIPQLFDNLLDAIQSMLMSFLTKLGPFFVALMPALFTAYAIFHTFATEAGEVLAMLFAVIVGLAMETVGIVATHTAIDLYNAKEQEVIQPVKFRLMVWLVPIYVIGVAAVVGFSEDAFTPLVKGLGIASPFLTSIVYIAVALARDIKRTETKQSTKEDRQAEIEADERAQQAEIKAEGRAWKREQERLVSEMKHKERLAEIEAKNVNQGVNQGVNQDGQTVKKGVKLDVFDTINLSKEEKRNELLDRMVDIYLDNPEVGVSTVAHSLNVSRQTVYNYQDELRQAGRLGKNGQNGETK